jgi:hypothetical protein
MAQRPRLKAKLIATKIARTGGDQCICDGRGIAAEETPDPAMVTGSIVDRRRRRKPGDVLCECRPEAADVLCVRRPNAVQALSRHYENWQLGLRRTVGQVVIWQSATSQTAIYRTASP